MSALQSCETSNSQRNLRVGTFQYTYYEHTIHTIVHTKKKNYSSVYLCKNHNLFLTAKPQTVKGILGYVYSLEDAARHHKISSKSLQIVPRESQKFQTRRHMN